MCIFDITIFMFPFFFRFSFFGSFFSDRLDPATVVGRNTVDLKMLTYARSTSEGQIDQTVLGRATRSIDLTSSSSRASKHHQSIDRQHRMLIK